MDFATINAASIPISPPAASIETVWVHVDTGGRRPCFVMPALAARLAQAE